MKTLAIRVSEDDHKLFVALADREDMPLSSLVRRQLRALAREHAMLVDTPMHPPTDAGTAKPVVQKRARPVDANGVVHSVIFNEQLLQEHERGDSVSVLAEAYSLTPQDVQRRVALAREHRSDGTLATTKANQSADPNGARSSVRVMRRDAAGNIVMTDAPHTNHTPTTRAPSAPHINHHEPELVYDPVDPDNPTEEEQAINAEIARRKLVDMGLL